MLISKLKKKLLDDLINTIEGSVDKIEEKIVKHIGTVLYKTIK